MRGLSAFPLRATAVLTSHRIHRISREMLQQVIILMYESGHQLILPQADLPQAEDENPVASVRRRAFARLQQDQPPVQGKPASPSRTMQKRQETMASHRKGAVLCTRSARARRISAQSAGVTRRFRCATGHARSAAPQPLLAPPDAGGEWLLLAALESAASWQLTPSPLALQPSINRQGNPPISPTIPPC